MGSHPLAPFVRAVQPLSFTLRRRALTFVRALLALVGPPLAVVRNLVALVGDTISSTGLEFAPVEVCLAPSESHFALIELVSAAFRLGWVLGGHSSP